MQPKEGGVSIADHFNKPHGKRIRRGRLHFSEEEMTGQAGDTTSGQVGPKPQSTGKFKQDEEREKFSSRLQNEDARREGKQDSKEKKSRQEKNWNGRSPKRNIPRPGWNGQRTGWRHRSPTGGPAP